jgi:hypothetical protein
MSERAITINGVTYLRSRAAARIVHVNRLGELLRAARREGHEPVADKAG